MHEHREGLCVARVFLAVALASLGWSGDPALASDTTVFLHVNLVPMTSDEIVENQYVVVRGSEIAAIGPAKGFSPAEDARVIDGAGSYLMPGLADMHVHTDRRTPYSPFNLFLANGVTTIRDLDGRPSMVRWRDEIRSGYRPGPALYSSGKIIGFNLQRKAALVPVQKELGHDCIKTYGFLAENDLKETLAAAKAAGMYSVGHIPLPVGLERTLELGLDEIAHVQELVWQLVEVDTAGHTGGQGEFMERLFEEFPKQYGPLEGLDESATERLLKEDVARIVRAVKQHDVTVNTTMAVGETIKRKCSDPEAFLSRPSSKYLPQSFIENLRSGKDEHLLQYQRHSATFLFIDRATQLILRELKKAGVRLVLGTDVQQDVVGILPGFSMHDELRRAVEAGFTPYEAIAAATRGASEIVLQMTGRDEFGTIEVGKRADFILLDKSPLEDVGYIKDHKGVMAAGRWYTREQLDQLQETKTVAVLPMFFREALQRENGVAAALAWYETLLMSNHANEYWTDENDLRTASAVLMYVELTGDATRILESNLKLYQNSSATHDSLGEIHLKTGDQERAKESYRRSLDLNPNNKNAISRLQQLNGES